MSMKSDNTGKAGFVSLVGAGPGDPGLFSLKGARRLEQADIVIYDYLANLKLLSYCRSGCERIYVGKKAGAHTLSQEEINRLILRHAEEGKRVVRLKGGDPFVFGRGGEEALYLAEAGIPFDVVPGVTAGIAAAAYAGIPVTHRELASSLAFVTGHESADKGEPSIDWKKTAGGADTLVFYMGVKNLTFITEQLQKYGRSGDTPAAIVRWGTFNSQKTVTGTVATIAAEAAAQNIKPPALIVVGPVVALRDSLRWFDNRPLSGKRIVVTRSRTQASKLSEVLEEKGAEVAEFPTIDILPLKDQSGLDSALGRIRSYSWIIFTSVNGVDLFFRRLHELGSSAGNDARALAGIRFAVIGGATAETLRGYGVRPDLMPESFTSEGTVEAFQKEKIGLTGAKVLMPGSDISRDYIPVHLREMGADVEPVPVYRNVRPSYTPEEIEELFHPAPFLVTFTSSSTVANFVEIIEGQGRPDLLKTVRGVSIGPVTSGTAAELGVPIAAEAEIHTIDGLVAAVEKLVREKI